MSRRAGYRPLDGGALYGPGSDDPNFNNVDDSIDGRYGAHPGRASHKERSPLERDLVRRLDIFLMTFGCTSQGAQHPSFTRRKSADCALTHYYYEN